MDALRNREDVKAAAEFVLSQTNLGQRVPKDVRQEIDTALRRASAARSSVSNVWREFQVKERFGISCGMFREYARQVWAADHDQVHGSVMIGLATLYSVPLVSGEELKRRGQTVLQARLAEVLGREDLPPEQLAKVVDAVAKVRTAEAKLKALKLAAQRLKLQSQARGKKVKSVWDDPEELQRRVRKIYGIEMPKCDDNQGARSGERTG